MDDEQNKRFTWDKVAGGASWQNGSDFHFDTFRLHTISIHTNVVFPPLIFAIFYSQAKKKLS